MPRPQTVSVAFDGTASSPIPINWRASDFGVSVRVTNSGNTASKVQYTFDNVIAGETPTWIDAPSSTGLEAVGAGLTEIGSIAFPCQAIRVAVTAGSSGAATMVVIQQG